MCSSSKISTTSTSNNPECEICCQEYNTSDRAPRSLSCGHTICTQCAQTLWDQQGRSRIVCPFDRKETFVSGGSLDGNLPKNYLALQILEAQNLKPNQNSQATPTGYVSKRNAGLEDLITQGNQKKLEISQKIQETQTCLDSFSHQNPEISARNNWIKSQFEDKKRAALGDFYAFSEAKKSNCESRKRNLELEIQKIQELIDAVEHSQKGQSQYCDVSEVMELRAAMGRVMDQRDEGMDSGGD